MAVKSIIEIDVKSEAFKEFQGLFDRYRDQLSKMPGAWQKVGQEAGKAQKAAAEGFGGSLAILTDIHNELKTIGQALNTTTVKARSTGSAFGEIARTTGRIAKNVTNTTFQLLKWVALGGTLGAATGFFGADVLAGRASSLRKTAQGLTVSPGELRATQINLGRYIDPEQVLGSIANAQTDIQQQALLARLGIRGADLDKSPAQLLPRILPQLVDLYKQHGHLGAAYLSSTGLDQLVDIPTIKRLAGLPPGELQNALGQFQQDQKQVAVQDKLLYQLQLLDAQFRRAGGQIENVLIAGLVKLAPHIEKLSAGIVDVLQALSHSPAIKKWMGELEAAIEKTAQFIEKPEFQRGVETFISGITRMAQIMWHIIKWFAPSESPSQAPAPSPGVPGTHSGATGHWDAPSNVVPIRPSIAPTSPLRAPTLSLRQQQLRALDAQYGLAPGTMDYVWMKESSRGKHLFSRAGAIGPFQFMPGTAADLGLYGADLYDFDKSSNAAARYLAQQMTRFVGDPVKAVAAYNAGPGRVEDAIRQYHGDWLRHLRTETQNYADPDKVPGGSTSRLPPQTSTQGNVRITIADITGGSVNVNASQLAAV